VSRIAHASLKVVRLVHAVVLQPQIARISAPPSGNHMQCDLTTRRDNAVYVYAMIAPVPDSALYHAKEGGRNRTHVISANT
jgi:hypothetical protein